MDDADRADLADTTAFDRGDLERDLDRQLRPGGAFTHRGVVYEISTVDDRHVHARAIGY